jgi:hypothetical protein
VSQIPFGFQFSYKMPVSGKFGRPVSRHRWASNPLISFYLPILNKERILSRRPRRQAYAQPNNPK